MFRGVGEKTPKVNLNRTLPQLHINLKLLRANDMQNEENKEQPSSENLQ